MIHQSLSLVYLFQSYFLLLMYISIMYWYYCLDFNRLQNIILLISVEESYYTFQYTNKFDNEMSNVKENWKIFPVIWQKFQDKIRCMTLTSIFVSVVKMIGLRNFLIDHILYITFQRKVCPLWILSKLRYHVINFYNGVILINVLQFHYYSKANQW